MANQPTVTPKRYAYKPREMTTEAAPVAVFDLYAGSDRIGLVYDEAWAGRICMALNIEAGGEVPQ